MTQKNHQNVNNPWLKPALMFIFKISGVVTLSALLSIWGGMKIDTYFSTNPIFTIILTILGFVFSIFIILKEVKVYKKSL